jgi:hypothetical protein
VAVVLLRRTVGGGNKEHTDALTGCVVIVGADATTNTTPIEVTGGGQVPETTTS